MASVHGHIKLALGPVVISLVCSRPGAWTALSQRAVFVVKYGLPCVLIIDSLRTIDERQVSCTNGSRTRVWLVTKAVRASAKGGSSAPIKVIEARVGHTEVFNTGRDDASRSSTRRARTDSANNDSTINEGLAIDVWDGAVLDTGEPVLRSLKVDHPYITGSLRDGTVASIPP